MRRKDREVTDRNEILEIIRRCDVCRIGLIDDDGTPYIVPLNFGVDAGDEITLYFHSATEGHKLDLIARNSRASFEMDCRHELQYFEDKGYCTMAFESVMGKGTIRILNDEEKLDALKKLMRQYHGGQDNGHHGNQASGHHGNQASGQHGGQASGQHSSEDVYFSTAAIPRTTVFALTVDTITAKRKLPK